MKEFRSFLKPIITKFIEFRIISEQWNATYETNLRLFDNYVAKNYPAAEVLTQEMVYGWCTKRDTEKNTSFRSRTYVVYTFIQYLYERRIIDFEVPVFCTERRNNYFPHFFSEVELQRFFDECDRICEQRRNRNTDNNKLTVPVFFRFLYSTGIRTTGARLLKRTDVNLQTGVVSVEKTKGYHQHYIVMHDSMLALMKKYDEAINLIIPDRLYFFPKTKETGHNGGWVTRNFHINWDKANPGIPAVPYDLRHNYAITNINAWMNIGFESNTKIHYLSKSMGHSTIQSTLVYYSLIPYMAELIYKNTNDEMERMIPEILYEESE